MSKKYNFSVTIPVAEGFNEKLEVTGCDSFDEAINTVEKAVKDRMQVLSSRANKPAKQTDSPLVPGDNLAKVAGTSFANSEDPNNQAK